MIKPAKNALSSFQSIFHTTGTRHLHRKKPGQPPGTLVHTGARKLDEIIITVHDYDVDHYDVIPIKEIDKSEPFLKSKSKTWIQIQGLHDIEKLQSVWQYFNLHPLVQEDILSTGQRPKVEPYDEHVFVVMRMIVPGSNANDETGLKSEQISIVLGENYVLSFQESDEPIFAPIFKRLDLQHTRLRKFGSDYLMYALIDNVVDHYFNALDLIGESIEVIEEQIIAEPDEKLLGKIHGLRRDLIFFRKSIWSLRDGINLMVRDDSTLIDDTIKVYLRDVYDHVVQVIDSIESSREMVYSLYDMYMSGLSNKMNEVMKVLTIIATIFIPLTFIAGIYGMNFNPDVSPYNMPELEWYFGYPLALLLMGIIFAFMLVYFRRKNWM